MIASSRSPVWLPIGGSLSSHASRLSATRHLHDLHGLQERIRKEEGMGSDSLEWGKLYQIYIVKQVRAGAIGNPSPSIFRRLKMPWIRDPPFRNWESAWICWWWTGSLPAFFPNSTVMEMGLDNGACHPRRGRSFEYGLTGSCHYERLDGPSSACYEGR
jgi:hypothetical protein